MCARVIVTPFFDVPDDHHHRVVLSWLRASLSRDSSSPQQNISSSRVLELNVFSISRHTGVAVDSLTKHTNSIATTTTEASNTLPDLQPPRLLTKNTHVHHSRRSNTECFAARPKHLV
uniref:(northern house mosquito) hypothetical protein n=1 Tax=Culex pipiens TaxID=7175 RepID=A0A8D8KMQ5_CULPI